MQTVTLHQDLPERIRWLLLFGHAVGVSELLNREWCWCCLTFEHCAIVIKSCASCIRPLTWGTKLFKNQLSNNQDHKETSTEALFLCTLDQTYCQLAHRLQWFLISALWFPECLKSETVMVWSQRTVYRTESVTLSALIILTLCTRLKVYSLRTRGEDAAEKDQTWRDGWISEASFKGVWILDFLSLVGDFVVFI